MAIFISYIPEEENANIEVRKWFNKPWTMLFRPTNNKLATTLASKMLEIIENKNIIYNLNKQSELFNFLKQNKWDFQKIENICLSNNFALISACLNSIGIFINTELNYKNISKILFNTGRFNKITTLSILQSSDNLKVGDILVCEDNIALVISNKELISTPSQQKGNVKYVGKGIGTATAIKRNVEIRNGDNEKYKIIDTLKKLQTVEVLGLTEDGWYKIVWPQSMAGYAYTKAENFNYKGEILNNSNIPKIVNYTVKVIVDNLKIERSFDNTKPFSMGILKKGTTHKIIKEHNNYGLLQSGRGWISLDGVEKV